jgi:predicted nucleic acid-binding protein
MPGSNQTPPLLVIGDTDGLIALLNADDLLFNQAKQTVEYLAEHNAQIIFPVTTIAETITTFTRKLKQPALAAHIIEYIRHGELLIDAVDLTQFDAALWVFDPAGSKKNTIFDALVVATADKLGARTIFSFDAWYTKLGYTLAFDLVGQTA